jgi:predicted amidohydrolase
MKVAALQMHAVQADARANLEKISRFAVQAKEQGADILIVPELAVPGYGAGEDMAGLTQLDGTPVEQILQHISDENQIALVAGFAERVDGTVYNSAAFCKPGSMPVIYRKSHLYGPYERDLFQSVEPMTCLVEFQGMKLGMLICYDVEFPENTRRLANAGADFIIVPTATPQGHSGQFIADKMIPVRAFENQVFIAYINHCGTDTQFAYQGGSGIYAPDGQALARANDKEEFLITSIDTAAFDQSRSDNPYLTDL